jgi:putative ABC transport system permease protein
VGIVADTKRLSLSEAPDPQMYVPYQQDSWWAMDVVVQSNLHDSALAPEITVQVHALDKALVVDELRPMESIIRDTEISQRSRTFLLGLFGAMALMLTAVGIYGVISYNVSQRTHEIGIRVALGARPGDVLKAVILEGLRLAFAGLLFGFLAALALTRLLENFLFEISRTDPLTFIAVPMVLMAVAMMACLVPTRRALRVDPLTALRYE